MIPATPTEEAESPSKSPSSDASLAPFNPTCEHAINVALRLFQLDKSDVLFDLGCGDARLLTQAVQQHDNICCVGIEMDERFVQKALSNIQLLDSSQQARIQVRHGNALENQAADIDDSRCGQLSLMQHCTALYLYLLPKGLQRIRPLLEELVRHEGRQIRIVTYMFQLKGWKPAVVDRSTKGEAPVYLYDQSSWS